VSSDDVSWSKSDESRLRQLVVRLKDERSLIKLTIVDLESVHLDPFTCEPKQDACEAQKLDLENAVLMQELMAIKVICCGSTLLSFVKCYLYCMSSLDDGNYYGVSCHSHYLHRLTFYVCCYCSRFLCC